MQSASGEGGKADARVGAFLIAFISATARRCGQIGSPSLFGQGADPCTNRNKAIQGDHQHTGPKRFSKRFQQEGFQFLLGFPFRNRLWRSVLSCSLDRRNFGRSGCLGTDWNEVVPGGLQCRTCIGTGHHDHATPFSLRWRIRFKQWHHGGFLFSCHNPSYATYRLFVAISVSQHERKQAQNQ